MILEISGEAFDIEAKIIAKLVQTRAALKANCSLLSKGIHDSPVIVDDIFDNFQFYTD